jgi:hypothetical protein
MRAFLIATAGILTAGAASAEIDTFDKATTGAIPPGWICGVTGQGSPDWTVEADPSAPSGTNVLKQSIAAGRGATFPWCVKTSASMTDGYVEVRLKPLEGKEDQAGGVIWRWKDGGKYYVARANALENNVWLYYTEGSRRIGIMKAEAPVAGNQWHILRVEFAGTRIKVLFDGKSYIDVVDTHISGEGAAGVWTKADSVTAFDDFAFGE